MKILRGQFLGLLVLLCAALPLQGMFSSRLSKAMQQKKQQLQLKQLRQQKMGYSGVPTQPGWFDRLLISVGLKKSPEPFVQQQFLPKLEQPSSMAMPVQLELPAQEERSHLAQEGFSEQQEPFMQKEEDTTRRDEMFAFMEEILEEAKEYSFKLEGTDLSRTINKLYEYEDVLNQVKDGHTILGEIISLYGFHFKREMDEAKIFKSLNHFKTERVLKFFREVKKLGASNVTSDDFKEIEKIKNDFLSFLTTRYNGAEELIPVEDILVMADVFEELKGEDFSFWLKANKINPLLLSYSSFIDIEYDYRNHGFFLSNERNAKAYNDLTQLLKDAIASIFGLKSEFYQNFVNRLQKVSSYTDSEVNEIKKMRDKIKDELVDKKQQKLWQDWQVLRKQKPGEKEEQQQYERQQQELAYAAEQKAKAAYKKQQPKRDEEQIKREYQEEQQRKQKEQEEILRKQKEKEEQQRRYQEEQTQRAQQRREQQQKEQRQGEEEREKRERAKQEEERHSPEELEILMTLARMEYVKELRKHTSNIFGKLSFSSISSDEELNTIYKGLMKELHPDTKGDVIKAQSLNAARTAYLQAKKAFDKSKQDQLKDQLSRE